MSNRIVNLNRQFVIQSNSQQIYTPSLSTPTSIRALIENLTTSTLIIPDGIYTENLSIPSGINVKTNGYVKIIGNVILEGDGSICDCEITGTLTVRGKRSINNLTVKYILIQQNGFANCWKCHIKYLSCINGQFSIANSSLGREIGTNTLHLVQNSSGFIESSAVNGQTFIGSSSVLECRNSSLIGNENEDLVDTEDETSTFQIFNCTVYGSGNIKVGAGTSIRSNVIPLSEAVDFIGGENIKIEPV